MNIDTLNKEIKKKYDIELISGKFLTELTGNFIPTTLSLDIALHGGIREGTVTSISSPAKAGKTSLCLKILANAQKMGKNVYYCDAEGRLSPELLNCIDGLDKEKLNIITSSKDKFLTAEAHMNIVETLLRDDPGCVVVVDSIAALCPEGEYADDVKGNGRSSTPKLMYSFFRKIAQMIRPNKSTLIVITHLQANTSGYGSPFKEVGGNGQQYFASNWLMAKSVKKIENNEKKEIGKDTMFTVLASQSGAPGGEATIYVRYGRGCDKYEEVISLGEELALIEKSGAWYQFSESLPELASKKLKFQGRQNLALHLMANKEDFDIIENKIRETAL